MSKKNAYLLLRSSVHETSEAVLQRQEQELRDYCHRNDYNIVGVAKVIGDSGDVALTLKNVIQQSDTQQNIDALVITGMDRISRDSGEALSVRDALASHGLELEAADGSHMNLETLCEIADHAAEYEADAMGMNFEM